jgi:putative oxidoreductase
MTRLRQWLFDASAPRSVILIRLLVGCVFFSEGVQKFLFPAALGVGRFQKIGIPTPQFFGPFVGVVEIVCGALVIVGLVTRLASIPLLMNISVAIATTKIPMFARSGLWATLHEARTDFCMFLGSVFLIACGSGEISLDAILGNSEDRTGISFGRDARS